MHKNALLLVKSVIQVAVNTLDFELNNDFCVLG